MALPVIKQELAKRILQSWATAQLLSGNTYVAPSVYLKGGTKFTRWNYYSTKEKAMQQLLFLSKEPGGVEQKTVAGYVSFKPDSTAQTFGINCDLFVVISRDKIMPTPPALAMEIFKQALAAHFIIRMNTPTGAGPFYAVIDIRYFGIAANKVKASGEKLKEMTAFYNNIDLIKARYNALVSTINELTEKPFNPVTQGTINRLTQQRITMLDQIRSIKNCSIITSETGAVGLAFLPLIVVLVIAGVAGWGLTTWITERQKSQRIAEALNHQRIIAAEQKKIMDECAAGKYTPEQCKLALQNLGIAFQTGQKVAEESAKQGKGLFDNLSDIAKYGLIALVVIVGSKFIGGKK